MAVQGTKAKRKRGRPRSTGDEDASLVSRDMVIDLAYEEGRTRSLNDISFVGLARTLGVVPGSLHYHIGTKDDLTSAILNRFYKGVLRRIGEAGTEGDWREQITRLAWILMRCEQAHRGATEHIQTQPKYRLFQKVAPGQTDYGAAFLDHVFRLFRDAGFDARQTALFYHALAMHCLPAGARGARELSAGKGP